MYLIRYYLPNQSQLFSNPQQYEAKDREDLHRVLSIAEMNNYDVISVDEIVNGELIPII